MMSLETSAPEKLNFERRVTRAGLVWRLPANKNGAPSAFRTAFWLAIACAILQALFANNVAAGTDKGKELAERLCAVCHMNTGQGEKTGPGTVPGFAAIAKRPGQTLNGIIAWLKSVPPMMPDHHLTQDEMHTLAFFILSLRDSTATN